MKIIVILLLTATLSGCSLLMPVELPSSYEDRQYGIETRSSLSSAELIWQTLNVIDMGQTIHIARSPNCYYEKGFPTQALVGRHPSEKEVYLTSVLYAVGYRTVSNWLEKKDTVDEYGEYNSPWHIAKITWYGVTLFTKARAVYNNNQIGLRPWGRGC